MRTKIAAGNWKMNGDNASLNELKQMCAAALDCSKEVGETIICPPFTLLSSAVELAKDTPLKIGAQNAHFKTSGAYTGEISPSMLKELGVSHVILGHSERREYFNEDSALIAQKAQTAHEEGLIAIICVGETLEEREAGNALSIVGDQVSASLPQNANAQNTIIAYEPVWAIGTGKVPSNEDIAQMHNHIRTLLPQKDEMRILYGGSVKGSNAKEIFALESVDGGLVGGASLKALDFIPIIHAANNI